MSASKIKAFVLDIVQGRRSILGRRHPPPRQGLYAPDPFWRQRADDEPWFIVLEDGSEIHIDMTKVKDTD
jgi:hypothetical protein